jgi:hypothetical protein
MPSLPELAAVADLVPGLTRDRSKLRHLERSRLKAGTHTA